MEHLLMVLILMIIVDQLFQKKLKFLVKKHKAQIGISLDGDADRIIISDEKGKLLMVIKLLQC